MIREPHVHADAGHSIFSTALHISDQPAFINWTVLDKFVRNDMGLCDEGDLRRAVSWAADEIKALAVKFEQAERLAVLLKSRLEDETDKPLREALVGLGWRPPGDSDGLDDPVGY